MNAYRSYWRYLQTLHCEQLTALTMYKLGSLDINNLLRVMSSTKPDDPSIEFFRQGVMQSLVLTDSAISNSRKLTEVFITKIQDQIRLIDSLYASTPRLEKKLVVFLRYCSWWRWRI